MNSIKEITVFSIGDSEKMTTWSNVPYFFTKSLLEKGIIINRVNIEEHKVLSTLYKYSFYLLLKLIYPKTHHTYFRSTFNHFLTQLKINKAVKKYPQTDVYLFLTYSFGLTSIKHKQIALFSDWCYLYKIQEQEKRSPFWFEKAALQREATNIKEADIIFSLFPKSQQFILDQFDNQACYYLGNVINSEQLLNTEDIIQLKQVSSSVIFIGNKKYINGAKSLVNACNLYNQKNKQSIVVNIIGLTKEELLIEDNSSTYFHGYLDKGNKEQSLKYYQLLKEAKVIINTTENWGGFSSMTEAMYHYTPVITTPYSEFVETYGEKLTCGFYASSQEELLNSIETIFSADIKQYNQYCYAANDLVKDFTWDNYIERFLKIITQ